jgi:hypothetical protein
MEKNEASLWFLKSTVIITEMYSIRNLKYIVINDGIGTEL